VLGRNEERNLPRLFASLEGLADEIVYVDTGSTDRSVEIARSFGAKVVQTVWTSDFAFHRNQSMAAATGRWLLIIDSDEEVAHTDKEEFRRHLEEERHQVLMVRQHLLYPGGRSIWVLSPRLVVRGSGIRFVHPIHEQLGVAECEAMLSSLCIVHHGYSSPEDLKAKEQRNLDIAMSMPDDSIHGLHCRARAATTLEKWAVVFDSCDRLMSLKDVPDMILLESCILAATGALSSGASERLDGYLAKARSILPDAPDVLFLDMMAAARRYLCCIEEGDSVKGGTFVRPWLFWHDSTQVRCLVEALAGKRRVTLYPGQAGPEQGNIGKDGGQVQLPEGGRDEVGKFVSLVVVNLNGKGVIEPCLESIRQHTRVAHEVIVVDNGSNDGSLEYLRSVGGIRLVANPENAGAVEARNQALTISTGDCVVFLDNDVVVTQGWVERLLECANSDASIGLVGPRSNFASGPQLVVGAQYGNYLEMAAFARGWGAACKGSRAYVHRLVLFCMLVKRQVVERIGGFDPSFDRWGWEDDDYGVRSQAAGFKLALANDAFVHHAGSRTSVSAGIDYGDLLRKNWDVFRRKWDVAWKEGQPLGYSIETLMGREWKEECLRVPLPSHADVAPLLQPSAIAEASDRSSDAVGTSHEMGLPQADMIGQEFASLWKELKAVPGWLSEEEACLLFEVAARTVRGRIVELGSYKGRSTVALARGRQLGRRLHKEAEGGPVLTVDTFEGSAEHQPGGRWFDPRSWDAVKGAVSLESGLRSNLVSFRVDMDVEVAVSSTIAAAARFQGGVGLLFVDAGHGRNEVAEDLAAWAPHVIDGGLVVLHDVGEWEGPTAVAAELLRRGYIRVSRAGTTLALLKPTSR